MNSKINERMEDEIKHSMKKEEAFLEEGKVHNNEEITKVEFLELNRRYQTICTQT